MTSTFTLAPATTTTWSQGNTEWRRWGLACGGRGRMWRVMVHFRCFDDAQVHTSGKIRGKSSSAQLDIVVFFSLGVFRLNGFSQYCTEFWLLVSDAGNTDNGWMHIRVNKIIHGNAKQKPIPWKMCFLSPYLSLSSPSLPPNLRHFFGNQ